MSRISLYCFCLAGFLLSSSGCQEGPATESQSQAPEPAAPETESPEQPVEPVAPVADEDESATVQLTTVTFDELQEKIAAAKGKVVVLDYWSTSCTPCLTEFPGLVAIHKEFPHDQVKCISASLDFEALPDFPLEEARKAPLEFLEQQQAKFDNYILSEDSLVVIDEKLKIASIPAVFVYGPDGKLAKEFNESTGETFTYEKDITPFVKELVASSFSSDSTPAKNE